MDENYLDNLLNEFSLDKEIDNKIEDEIDQQLRQEKKQHQEKNTVSKEDLFNLDLEQDADFSGLEQDLFFSEEQMDELDNLDNLADLDIGDLDFSDIDFNDLDMTKLDGLDTDSLDDFLKDFEGDLEISDSFDETEASETEAGEAEALEDVLSSLTPQEEAKTSEQEIVAEKESETEQEAGVADLNEDTFDTDEFLDSLLEETQEQEAQATPIKEIEEESGESVDSVSETSSEGEESELDLLNTLDSLEEPEQKESDEVSEYDAMDALDGFSDLGQMEELPPEELPETVAEENAEQELSREEADELDDLLSLLDMEEEDGNSSLKGAVADLDDTEPLSLDELEGDLDTALPEKKKKKSLMQILFGDPDEDDILSEEELAAIDAKKAERKAAKEAKKKAAQEAKEEKAAAAKLEKDQKRLADNEKKRVKAEKKAKKKAEAAAEAAAAEPEKQLNTPMVIFIFTLFLGGTFVFYMASNNFNYAQAIEKATKYFESQKYHKAYDEIKGVEVKEKDRELKERIYTVMYVERLYESYENNVKLGQQERALDSLLRGVSKYYEHYEEAVELGITDDLDYSFSQIQNTLQNRYGITIERALEINALENYEYVTIIKEYVVQLPAQEEQAVQDAEITEEMPKEDALPATVFDEEETAEEEEVSQ